ASVTPDAEMAANIASLAGPINEVMQTVVAETSAPIDGDRGNCRAKECEMGVLVAEAMLDKVADQGVTIAIQNGGGLRASIDAGEVTMGEVLTVLPFQNTLATFKLSGADVVTALENGVSRLEDGAGRFPQVAGLRYAFDAAAAPGSRITEVQVMAGGDWAAIDPAAMYGVVSNNYMRGGGDGYSTFANNAVDAYDFGPGLEQVVADYLAANSPYQPALRGAIVMGASFSGDAAPAPAATETAATGAESSGGYIVKAGDTLWEIAKAKLGDATRYTEIVELNGLTAGATLSIGQELKLP
ncbi:MAG: 5'-nucleotidase C-terminal domain-containing protein, partial [Pseudomonadota bacterium]